jgi:putative Mn2+ efflux pump MntP
MDAFAVSITLGLSVKKPKITEIVIPGLFFGFFQALMPAIGYFASIHFTDGIQKFDHWIAFALLGLIGGKMIKESLSKKEEKPDENAFQLLKISVLAVATSVDALAAGITFAFFKVNIFNTVMITGLVTFFISMTGVKIGNTVGEKLKSKSEFAGGMVLLMLGIKIVIEHLLFAA